MEGCGKAAEGIAKPRQTRPDLILLDMLMHDMPRDEALKALSVDPGTMEIPVVVVLPRYFPDGSREELKRMGRRLELVEKPVLLRDLKAVVEDLICRRNN